ncbi:MAG TPA: glutathione S-transferase family protein [Novosphingobium sp.]|nr:glutathione S-transferase family protein [Novosphingobium sp.]
MPVDQTAKTVVTTFDNVPDFARGRVRDIRIRWALEEVGRPYRVQPLDVFAPRPEGYRDWQPFGQVPAFADADVRLFESGAILLYLGEQDERLLPRDPVGRWAATSWLIAALNSVEPMLMQIVNLDVFQAGQAWAKEARPSALELACARLKSTEDSLGEKDWLAGRFSVADIMMVTVLRNIDHTDILAQFPALSAYKARGEGRPAFQRALADQMAGYAEPAN